jgi:two-component system, chemotaxis family, protein-glutamate methylesterase/glutaminase
MEKIRVLIVDDSAIVRKVLSDALSSAPDIEVAGTAPDPLIAREKIESLKPDVLTLDIEMPRMDGLTFLKQLMQSRPMPVIVISSLAQPSCRTAVEALSYGAVEVLAKPGGPYSVEELRGTLAAKVRAAASCCVGRRAAGGASKAPRLAGGAPSDVVFAIGASTGGTEAIASIVTRLPANSPGVVIAQHIPPQFSGAFAKRLDGLSAVTVKEAEDNDAVRPGVVLIAPGDLHMVLRKEGGRYLVRVKTGPRVCYQRPSVDVLFSSVAEAAGPAAVAALLTGMGTDGAQGMLRLHRAGAHTIAQDQATCVVYGMPREAVALGAAAQILPLASIAQAMWNAAHRRGVNAPAGLAR